MEFLLEVYTNTFDDLAPFITKSEAPTKEDWVDEVSLSKIKTRNSLREKLAYSTDEKVWNAFRSARNSA